MIRQTSNAKSPPSSPTAPRSDNDQLDSGTVHFMRCLPLADIATKALEMLDKDTSAVKAELPEPMPHDVPGEWFK